VNLVVVSNRVARGKANEPMTGGLAAALLPVVEKSGAIWVGSSGRVRDGANKEPFAEIEALGAGALAMLDLPAAHYGGYYEGFANSALWPALHSRADLIRASQDDYLSYREVNAFMARALLRFRKPDTAFWIQDYHFLALGAELRDLGVTQPLGFFLHTPWPDRAVIAQVRAQRQEMIILDPEYCVRLLKSQQRARHEGVHFAIAEIIFLGSPDQVGAGMQCRPQGRIRKTFIIAAVMRRRQIQHRQRTGAQCLNFGERFLLGAVTDPAAGTYPNRAGLLHHGKQSGRETPCHGFVGFAPRDTI
jgi:hypothetical protein